MDVKHEVAVQSAERIIARANDAIMALAEKLQHEEDRANVFAWAIKEVELSAYERVARVILHMLEKKTVSEVQDAALKEALQTAIHPSRSTSPISDLVSQFMTAAWARFAMTGQL